MLGKDWQDMMNVLMFFAGVGVVCTIGLTIFAVIKIASGFSGVIP